ncbi:MAG: rhodanese-like domain-containing protein [Cyclobacteriaceae bacterium]|nr:rhodanese-like domain-containing protein [Cyclobacteriaceae bacterium]
MISALKKLLGIGPKADIGQLIKEGAVVLDVRSKNEYKNGHVRGSVNIPLDQLSSNLSKLKKDKPIITCCASGMRSASAKSILKANGFNEVHNGGSWVSVNNKKS